ncbi:MAG TPA: TolC family protein [Candidatus Baltobacteraceae bacterium]|nr:TolC family protein [Candidatus Baltobacteraceae bacterium]
MTRLCAGAASLAFAAGCALASPAAAQDSSRFTPKVQATPAGLHFDALGAVRYALDHAPPIVQQEATVAQLAATFTKTRAGEYPTLTGQLQNQLAKSSNVEGQFAQFGIAPVSNFSQNTAALGSTYNIYNGTVQLTAQQQHRQLEAAKQDLRAQRQTTTLSVSQSFYNLAALRQVVVVDEGDLRFQQALLDAANASEKVGRVAGVDVLRAQVAVTRSLSSLVQARVDEQNAREALAVQIGAPVDSNFDVPNPLPEPPLPATPLAALTATAEANRAEILSARANLDAALLADPQIDSDLRPTFAASGSFGSQVSPTSLTQQQNQINAENQTAIANYEQEKLLFPGVDFPPPVLIPPIDRNRPGFWQIALTSTFQVPLYDYGTRATAHQAAHAQIDYERAVLRNAFGTVDADVHSSLRSLQADQEKLALAKQSAQLGSESARISQLQYKNGLISFTDITQTQQTALSADYDLVAAQVAYVVAFIKLRLSLGPKDALSAADLRGL